MQLIITRKDDKSTRQSFKVTAVEIDTKKNKLQYVLKDRPDSIEKIFMSTEEDYLVLH